MFTIFDLNYGYQHEKNEYYAIKHKEKSTTKLYTYV